MTEYDKNGQVITPKAKLVKYLRYGALLGCVAALKSYLKEEGFSPEEHVYHTFSWLIIGFLAGFSVFLLQPFYKRLKAWLKKMFGSTL